jgi:signal transduction histidine kinase
MAPGSRTSGSGFRDFERLERRSRELNSLHALARGLDGATEPDRVLALVGDAARNIAGAHRAEVVAQVDTHDRPWWSAPASPPFTVDARKAVEAVLGRHRAEGTSGLPPALPPGMLPVTIERGGALFGWVFLADPPPLSDDTRELLAVLAGLAATTLHNFELLEERIRSERLTMVGRMISTIVHDFRNPMTSIRGYAAMIQDMDIGPARRKECAKLVLEETDRMSAMIDEILEFTGGGGTPRLRRKRVTVEELVAKLERLAERDLKDRAVAFRAELGYPGAVIVDADRLGRALLNVATNAADAMPTGGTLTVRSRLRGDMVELEMEDTGHGIPAELQPRIFEPFFSHGKPRGVGLGMAITRKIVEDHGGTIALRSTVGVGTVFTVSIPAPPPATMGV